MTRPLTQARKFDLLVFDWDGTLIDSAAAIVAAIQAAISELNWEPRSENVLRNIIGLGWREACRHLYPEYPDSEFERLQALYKSHFYTGLRRPSALFDGVAELLQMLTDQGYLLAIATGKSRAGLNRDLQQTGLLRWIVTSRCADETTSKPHPQMLLEIMDELMIEPSRTLMIGDTEYDMEMARKAGTAAVAVSYGVHGAERLLVHQPLACLKGINELFDILEQ
jgi:phosphoglycolate phosphatase